MTLSNRSSASRIFFESGYKISTSNDTRFRQLINAKCAMTIWVNNRSFFYFID